MGTKALNGNNASTLSTVLHVLNEGLLVLLYFGSVMVLLPSDPYIKTRGLDSVSTTHCCGGLNCIACNIERGARGPQQVKSEAVGKFQRLLETKVR